MTEGRNILLMMSGSIACEKASGLIPELRAQGHAVNVACTAAVHHFVSRERLLELGASSVHSDTFDADAPMAHIDLSRWADLMILCPATANTINRLASGIADDMVTSTWIAAHGQGKPMIIVPAMNTKMYQYPATADSIRRLTSWGIDVLPTQIGDLACGETGEGRMLEVDQIMTHIGDALNVHTQAAGSSARILVTAGGTREYIDGVRYIGNLSSGRTGAALTDRLGAMGHQLTWLGARSAIRPARSADLFTYEAFDELDSQLASLLSQEHYDAVIHAAAVSDYRVDRVETDSGSVIAGRGVKLTSSDELTLRLKPNPKLLNRLVDYSVNDDIRVIAFKLTNTADKDAQKQAVDRVMRDDITAVVHNDLGDISADAHPFSVHENSHDDRKSLVTACSSVDDLAVALSRIITAADEKVPQTSESHQ